MNRLSIALYELLRRGGVPDEAAEDAAREFLLGFELRYRGLERDVWLLLGLVALNLLLTGLTLYLAMVR